MGRKCLGEDGLKGLKYTNKCLIRRTINWNNDHHKHELMDLQCMHLLVKGSINLWACAVWALNCSAKQCFHRQERDALAEEVAGLQEASEIGFVEKRKTFVGVGM